MIKRNWRDPGCSSRAEFRRTLQVASCDPQRAPVTLIARGADDGDTAAQLPLIRSAAFAPDEKAPPAWISEALQDLYGRHKIGDDAGQIPLAGRTADVHDCRYLARLRAPVRARSSSPGSAYVAATGDDSANEGSIWLNTGADAGAAEKMLRRAVGNGDALEIITSTALHERSLRIFDRAFAITYALEVIAVIIGLTGISFAASSTALARRAEFGMLRHIGMLRRQIIAMLADEGILTSAFGVVYGLGLGMAFELWYLVYVINRQSFNWSIDLRVPVWQSARSAAAPDLLRRAVTAGGAEMPRSSSKMRSARCEDWRAAFMAVRCACSACAAGGSWLLSMRRLRRDTPLMRFEDYGQSSGSFRTEWCGMSRDGSRLATGGLWPGDLLRTKPDIDENNPSAFAPRLPAWSPLRPYSDPKRGKLRQDQRIRRAGLGLADAAEGSTNVWIEGWSLKREDLTYVAKIDADDFSLDLALLETQACLDQR